MHEDSRAITVSLTVRHANVDRIITHSFEHSVSDGLNPEPKWLNRRIAAAVDDAVTAIHADFGITAEQAERGLAGDFVTDR